MASVGNIKQAAKNLRYQVPTGDDSAVLSDIAQQVGFADFHYPEDNDALYSILNDEMHRKGMDAFWGEDMDGNEYSEDEFYDSENDQYVYRDEDGNEYTRDERDEMLADEEGQEDSDEEVEEETTYDEDNSGSSDSSNSSSKDSSSDSSDDSSLETQNSKDETDIQNKVDEENQKDDAYEKEKQKAERNAEQSEGAKAGEKGEGSGEGLNKNNENPNKPNNQNEEPGSKNPAKNGDQRNQQSYANQNHQGEQPSSRPSGLDDGKPKNPANRTNGGNPDGGNYNGYDSRNVNKRKQNPEGGSNITDRANKKFTRDKKIKNDKLADKVGGPSKPGTDKPGLPGKKNTGKPGLGTGKKGGIGGKEKALNKLNPFKGKKGKNALKPAKDAAVKMTVALMKSPYFWIVLGVIVGFFVILMLIVFIATGNVTHNGKGGKNCKYNVNGILSTGTVELSNLEVELINCSGTESNYTVLKTIPFEDYVVGVAMAEIGSSSPDEAIKAQIIAARNFSLTRQKGMCPSNPDECFYGYNASTGKIRMRACEADQVYWNYTEDIYRKDEGSISKYSPEVDSSNGTLWHAKLDQKRIGEIETIAEAVAGEILIDSDTNIISTNYNSTTSNQFIDLANDGKTYKDILKEVYGSDSINGATCTSSGTIDYGDYTLTSDGDTIINEPLDKFLEKNGSSIEEFNGLIEKNVKDAGFGTRAGVVAAAVTLIAELGDNYDAKVPYFWGGGHGAIASGALGNWGSNECSTYANGHHYNRCGLDCSGFVAWAIANGGFKVSPAGAASYYSTIGGGKKTSISSSSPTMEPGDLIANSHHVVLIVGVDEASNSYIVAHASGIESGVLFGKWSYSYVASEYYGVKLDSYYGNANNIRES